MVDQYPRRADDQFIRSITLVTAGWYQLWNLSEDSSRGLSNVMEFQEILQKGDGDGGTQVYVRAEGEMRMRQERNVLSTSCLA
ncbi:hypothetical protein EYC84_011806 [Monilinia fructicola]|uniref:Uncharacterized protein n=1 Tax=Monilinia fructicola TaxID=38448 RepID=A0A5M9J4J7_MONFR|nr:hypothetical protein EYC84_011806 [Monilinia fructicola]